MKNIAILVPTLNKGGAERVAANLSIEFSKYYNVYVIVHTGEDIIYPYGGKLIDLQLPPQDGIFNKVCTLIKRVRKVREIQRKYKIDYTISHLPPSNNVNIFARGHGKVITYVHTMMDTNVKNFWMKRIREVVNERLSDKVICVSECVRQNMIKNFGLKVDKVTTIYNFIDVNNIKKNFFYNKESNEMQIVTMGRMTTQKGQWHLIRAMKKVCMEFPCAKLVIMGEGELKERLMNLSKKLGLEKNICFYGYLANPYEIISKSSVYVSSSNVEGLPMALIEAARCGVPIISTDCDAGCREILAPHTSIERKTSKIEYAKYGILVPICKDYEYEELKLSAQENVMAEAILKLLKDPILRKNYAELAFLRSNNFTPEHIMHEWRALLV